MAGYDFNINNWVAAEGDYDLFSNSQKYATSSRNFGTQTYVHGVTRNGGLQAAGVSQGETVRSCGWRTLVFDPRNATGTERRARGTFVYVEAPESLPADLLLDHMSAVPTSGQTAAACNAPTSLLVKDLIVVGFRQKTCTLSQGRAQTA